MSDYKFLPHSPRTIQDCLKAAVPSTGTCWENACFCRGKKSTWSSWNSRSHYWSHQLPRADKIQHLPGLEQHCLRAEGDEEFPCSDRADSAWQKNLWCLQGPGPELHPRVFCMSPGLLPSLARRCSSTWTEVYSWQLRSWLLCLLCSAQIRADWG